MIGQEYAGVHQVIVDSINKADLDLRKSLFSNVILSGGSTLTRGERSLSYKLIKLLIQLSTGFGDRLLNEIKKLALKEIKIKIYAPPERKYSTWIGRSLHHLAVEGPQLNLMTGGSILSGLSTFKRMWVSSEEWNEDPDISGCDLYTSVRLCL